MAASWLTASQSTGAPIGVGSAVAQTHANQTAWQSPRLCTNRGGTQVLPGVTRHSTSAPSGNQAGNQGSLKVTAAGNATSSSSPKQALRRMATTTSALRVPSPTNNLMPPMFANINQPNPARSTAAPPSPLLVSAPIQTTSTGSVRRSGSPPGLIKNNAFWRWQAEPELDTEGSPNNTPDAPKCGVSPPAEKNTPLVKDGRSQGQSPVLRFATSGLTVALPSSASSPPPVPSSGMGMLAANGQDWLASSRRPAWPGNMGGSQPTKDGSLHAERSPRNSHYQKVLAAHDTSSLVQSGSSGSQSSPGMVTRGEREVGAIRSGSASYSAPSSSGSHLLPGRAQPSSGSTADTPNTAMGRDLVPPAVSLTTQPLRTWRGKGNATVPSPPVQLRPGNAVTPLSPSPSARVLQSPVRQAVVRAGSNPPGQVSRSPQSPPQTSPTSSSPSTWRQRPCQATKSGVSDQKVDAPPEADKQDYECQSSQVAGNEVRFANKILELESEVQRLNGLLQEERDTSRVLKTALEANTLQPSVFPGSTDFLSMDRVGENGGLIVAPAVSVLPPFPLPGRSRDCDSIGDGVLATEWRREELARDEGRDAVESAASAAVLRLRSLNDSSGAAIAERILVAMRKTGEVGSAELTAVSERSSVPG